MGGRSLLLAAGLACLAVSACGGCVPLQVRTAGQPGVGRVMLSLFAGSCSG